MKWEVRFEIEAPDDASYEQVEEWARYNVGENHVVHAPMMDWEWNPVPFSVEVDLS